MCWGTTHRCFLALCLLLTITARAEHQKFLEQSFYFDWHAENQPVPVPVTRQCDTLRIKWSRGAAKGPNPTAPYTLQIYTSTFIVPFTVDAGSNLEFDWQVPFVPDTQYQVCMFDKNGNTGGCEAIYTVIEAESTPSCPNITFPEVLSVDATVSNGPMSQFGWIDSCSDIQLTPKDGTPPYTFTAAPSLHPPWNITADSMEAVNWTVALSWASPFFVSMKDSAGKAWSNGPLHAGGMGKTACLNIDEEQGETKGSSGMVSQSVTIGSAVGALIVGLLGGLLTSSFVNKRRKNQTVEYGGLSKNSPIEDHFASRRPSRTGQQASYHSNASQDSNTVLLNRMGHGEYAVEPFVVPPLSSSSGSGPTDSSGNNHMPPLSPSSTREPHSIVTHGPTVTPNTNAQDPPSPHSERPTHSVYVVHHDGGRAPVTVYTQDGAEVVELPPRYTGRRPEARPESSSGRRFFTTNGTSDADVPEPASFSEQRRPGGISKG